MTQQRIGSHARVVTQQSLPSEDCATPEPYRLCLDCRHRSVNDLDLVLRQCEVPTGRWPNDLPV